MTFSPKFITFFSIVCHFLSLFFTCLWIFSSSLSLFLTFFTLFVTFFEYPASKYWSQDVLRMTHNNVPKTFFKDPIRPSSGGLPNLTSWGCLRMTLNGRPREIDSGRPQDVLRTSTKWPWKHVLRTMWGHLLKFPFTFHWEIIPMTKSTLKQFNTQGVYRTQLNF